MSKDVSIKEVDLFLSILKQKQLIQDYSISDDGKLVDIVPKQALEHIVLDLNIQENVEDQSLVP